MNGQCWRWDFTFLERSNSCATLASPHIGVVTNIGTVHASRAGSQEEIARGKSELVQALPVDGYAILNYDDPLVRKMADQTHAHVFFYGMDNAADLWAENVESLGLEGHPISSCITGRKRTARQKSCSCGCR